MKKTFWQKLKKKKPFFCLAPMYDVTDFPFRQMFAKYSKKKVKNGGLDVIFTEFVSADGLCSEGKKKLLHHLYFKDNERPIVAQIFGTNLETIGKAVKIIKKLGFDGVDINMGCPDRTVVKQGAGSALIKNPKLAREIIRSAIKSAGAMPVSVKTRIGFNKIETIKWLTVLLQEKIFALTVHGRTKKEMSLVPAHWGEIKKAVNLRNKINKNILIIGNGDVQSVIDGEKKAQESGCDGIMVGRGVFGQPYFFNKNFKVDLKTKLKIMLEHTKLFSKIFNVGHGRLKIFKSSGRFAQPDIKNFESPVAKKKLFFKNFAVMRKHFKAYVSGFKGAKELRLKLMKAEDYKEVEKIIKDFSSLSIFSKR